MRRITLFVLALMLVCGAALADSYEEGRALYKAGKYPEAVAKLEQAVRENQQNAKAWWQLNFAYNKVGRDADSVMAVRKAHQIDPTDSFASSKAKYNEIQTTRDAQAAITTPPPTVHTSPPANQPVRNPAATGQPRGNQGLTQTLINADVFVERGMNVDAAGLERTAQELRPTVVKFAIFNSNANSRQLSREADRIREYLRDYINEGQGYVITASRRAVAVSSKSVGRDTLRDLTRQIAPQMEAGNYSAALEALARGLVLTRSSNARSLAPGTRSTVPIPRAHSTPWGLIILGIVGVIVVIVIISKVLKGSQTSREIKARKGPLEAQQADIIREMNYLDDSAGGLAPDVAAQVKRSRVDAGTKLDEASRLLRNARSTQDLNRAETLLDQAQGDIARGRAYVEGRAPAAAPAAAAGSAVPDWAGVPDNEKGICFFCSKPSRLAELTPVTVNLDGKQQKVLACPNDLQTIKSGQMPSIRAFNEGGRYVPWYASQGYDPYRDYYSRGYGGNWVSDMIMLSAIDNMFWGWHHPVGWGWGGGWGGYGGNTYVFYPDHDQYRDYYSGQAAGYGDFNRDPDNAGGSDFLGSTGGDYGGGSDLGGDRS